MLRRHWLPALLVFAATCVVLAPNAARLPQHGDEKMYVWKAAYYGGRLAHLDFSPGSDPYTDPGWHPRSFWAVEQPWGSHLLYALALGITRAPTAPLPYSYTDPALQTAIADIPAATLPIVRGLAVGCAALGLALMALRWGWPAAVAGGLLLAVPHVRADLARAWAEGPLLLGFGLCALSWRTRWFPWCIGLATGFKLTALALWPLVWFTAPIPFRRLRHLSNLAASALVVVLVTPYSWLGGGPFYLVLLLAHRLGTYIGQSRDYGGPLGFFMPTRYLWPVELAVLLAVSLAIAARIRPTTPPAGGSATTAPAPAPVVSPRP